MTIRRNEKKRSLILEQGVMTPCRKMNPESILKTKNHPNLIVKNDVNEKHLTTNLAEAMVGEKNVLKNQEIKRSEETVVCINIRPTPSINIPASKTPKARQL
jgi:hypothetical protein